MVWTTCFDKTHCVMMLKNPELMRMFKCNQCVVRSKQKSAGQHTETRKFDESDDKSTTVLYFVC